MTRRLSYPNIWAQSGTVADPDLDTTNPSYEANKYADIGWKAEKPPEEWQNFITQLTDAKIVDFLYDGIQLYDASVAYSAGSVYRKVDKVYTMVGGVEKEVLDLQAASFNAKVATLRKQYTDHMAASNPHSDTIKTLVGGGYYKAEVDTAMGSASDPQTIVYHKLQMGAIAHKTTAAQIGALPVAGGNFTGDVLFLLEAIFQVTPSQYLHYNKATALMELVNGTHALGIDAVGNGFIVNGSGATLILSEASMDKIVIKYNNQFALPVPLLKASWRSSLSDADSVGLWTVDTPAAPVFSGGLQVDNNAAILTFDSLNLPVTVQVLVTEASGTAKSYVKDFPTWTNVSNTNNLQTMVSVAMGGTNPKYFREYIVYPQLTANQKTMLVTS